MPPLTILVAVGEPDMDNTEPMAEAVRKVVGTEEADVHVAHVLTEEAYDRATDTLAEHVVKEGTQTSAGRPETGSLHIATTGTSRSSSTFAREQSELTPEDAAKRIIGQQTHVRDMVETLERKGIECEIRGAIGEPAERLLAMIEESRADFVVVGGRDRSPTRQAVFGSTSQKIISEAPCPVISVRPRESD